MSVFDNYQCEGQMSLFDLDTWCGKTYQEPSAQTKEKTSGVSLKKQRGSQIKTPLFLDLRGGAGVRQDVSWVMGGLLLGEYMMRSFGEYPREERESRLSQILEDQPHQKYCLSEKACQGILRRAERRGKELPPLLKETLLRQSASKNEPESQGGGKGILIQNERVGALSTLNNQSVLSVDEKMGQTYIGEEVGNTLGARDYKQPQSVVYCLQGNGIDRADTAGCNGRGWREDQSYTLNTIDRPAVMTMQRSDEYKQGGVCVNHSTERLQGCNGFGDTVGALCAGDAKHIGNQYVQQGKCIIQNIRKPSG